MFRSLERDIISPGARFFEKYEFLITSEENDERALRKLAKTPVEHKENSGEISREMFSSVEEKTVGACGECRRGTRGFELRRESEEEKP